MLQDIIEKYAESQPNATALLYLEYIPLKDLQGFFERKSISYKELNESSNKMAHYLESMGLKKGQKIGVCLENSIEAVISLVAIWKIGAIYLPLNPADPIDRITYIIKDSNLSCLVTHSTIKNQLSGDSIQFVDVENLFKVIEKFDAKKQSENQFQSDDAYCIYTSGTTGKPKGVTLDHTGLDNWMEEQSRIFQIKQEDRILQFAPISFDPNLWDILMALSAGACLCITNRSVLMDHEQLNTLFKKEKITGCTVTPTILSWLEPTKDWALRFVISTGEAFKTLYAERFFKLNIALYNAFGPSEVTFGVSIHKVEEKDLINREIPIGKAIKNMKMDILNESFEPVKEGMSGEICISGVGLSKKGYLNNEKLTHEKFVTHKNIQIYKTGDLGCYKNGDFFFLGRIDRQVKILGKRIEPQEIEQEILNIYKKFIEDVHVTAINTNEGEKRLVAYVVYKNEKMKNTLDFQTGLSSLPNYMIPSCFVPIDKIPLTLNGKIDEKSLPKPSMQRSDSYISPRNKIQKELQDIWNNLLCFSENDAISINSDFYAMGGNSILVYQLKAKIKEKFGVDYPMIDLLKDMTISSQSEKIENLQFKMVLLQKNGSSFFDSKLLGNFSLTPLSHNTPVSSSPPEKIKKAYQTFIF